MLAKVQRMPNRKKQTTNNPLRRDISPSDRAAYELWEAEVRKVYPDVLLTIEHVWLWSRLYALEQAQLIVMAHEYQNDPSTYATMLAIAAKIHALQRG
jgi:hypothetical protein